MDYIDETFFNIEKEHYRLVNEYIMGIIKIEEVNNFAKTLEEFRISLENVKIDEKNLLKIAKIKSKIQHYNTEIVEDEEVLKIAYSNNF